MALKVFGITVKPGVSFPSSEGLNTLSTQDALLTTAKADAALADTANDTALTSATTAAGNFASRVATQAAVDVLVADAATPTQAHVNDLVTAWNAFKTSLTTHETSATTTLTNVTTAETAVDTAVASLALVSLTANIAGLAGDVIIQVDTTAITTKTQLRAAMDAFYRQVSASNLFGV